MLLTVLAPMALACVTGFAALTLTGCASPNQHLSWDPDGQPRTDHPEQQWWHYEFVYHPQAQLYYEPYTKRYFWFNGLDQEWMTGDQPPKGFSIDPTVSKVVRVKTREPHMDHVIVLAVAGPHWQTGRPSSWETGQVESSTPYATVRYSEDQD